MSQCYYLRLFLRVVRRATRFEHLRTVDGIVYETFKAACISLRLLEDDDVEWIAMFSDGQTFMTGHALRCLFAMALRSQILTTLLCFYMTNKLLVIPCLGFHTMTSLDS